MHAPADHVPAESLVPWQQQSQRNDLCCLPSRDRYIFTAPTTEYLPPPNPIKQPRTIHERRHPRQQTPGIRSPSLPTARRQPYMPRAEKGSARRLRALPLTPATSSPTQEDRKAQQQSSRPQSHEEDVHPERTDELAVARAQISRIIAFIKTINTQRLHKRQNLVVSNPTDTTLWAFSAAVTPYRHSNIDLATDSERCVLAALLSRSLPRGTLRYRYILRPHRLIIRPMPSDVHDAPHEFIFTCLRDPEKSPLLQIFMPSQLRFIQVRVGTDIEVPGGPVESGYTNLLEDRYPGMFPRTKSRALSKQPDVALTYEPTTELKAYSLPGDGKEEQEQNRNGPASQGNKHREPLPLAAKPYPNIVLETGYSEAYQDLLADCADYLVSSAGKIRLVVLVNIEYQRQASDNRQQCPSDSDTDSGSRPASPASQPSDADDYERIAATAGDPATAAASPLSKPLTVFAECWTYNPLAAASRTSNTTSSPPYPILLRAPGRVYLLKDGVAQDNPGVYMCAQDFKLELDQEPAMKYISFRYLITVMLKAQTQMIYNDLVHTAKTGRARKRLAAGDVGADYREPEEEARGSAKANGKDNDAGGERENDGAGNRARKVRKTAGNGSVKTKGDGQLSLR